MKYATKASKGYQPRSANYRGSVGLLGYSQGAAVVSLEPSVSAISLPARESRATTSTPTNPIDWFDYCLPGDIYGDAILQAHTCGWVTT